MAVEGAPEGRNTAQEHMVFISRHMPLGSHPAATAVATPIGSSTFFVPEFVIRLVMISPTIANAISTVSPLGFSPSRLSINSPIRTPAPEGEIYKSNLPMNLEAIKICGYKNVMISTDSGQLENPPWHEALSQYVKYLLEAGIQETEIYHMTHTIQEGLLGIGRFTFSYA